MRILIAKPNCFSLDAMSLPLYELGLRMPAWLLVRRRRRWWIAFGFAEHDGLD